MINEKVDGKFFKLIEIGEVGGTFNLEYTNWFERNNMKLFVKKRETVSLILRVIFTKELKFKKNIISVNY